MDSSTSHFSPTSTPCSTASIARLLPGGEFVGEFGGHGNVAAIVVALQVALAQQGAEARSPWYVPTEQQFGERLEAYGFRAERLERFGRPTPLPTGIDGWLETFAFPLLTPLEEPASSAWCKSVQNM